MLAKYFSIIRNYVLSVSSQRKYNFNHQNTFLGAFRTNSRNIIGRNPSMVIPLLASQDLTPMLVQALILIYQANANDLGSDVIYFHFPIIFSMLSILETFKITFCNIMVKKKFHYKFATVHLIKK